jgi:dTDP-4-amino-4,6-dideoxygalactose transaminase
MKNRSFPPWPCYEPDEIAAVTRVLESGRVNYWTGDEGRKFEQEFAAYHGAEYGVAVANGTVALDLALLALGIGGGDEVVVTPRTFIASASCIVNAGARPVFADVDRDSGNITADSVRKVVTEKTRAIMAVHLGGWPCDMEGLAALAEEKGLYLIEDCAQAHGARIDRRPVGSFGDVAAFSFCTDKIMTTGGEGGMVLTSNPDLRRCMWEYKDHGKSWDAVYNREHPPGFRWLHETFGTNWRLTEMQSAMGRVQLAKLDQWIEKRRENARVLIEGLSGVPGLRVPVPDAHVGHSWYKFYAYVEPERLKAGWSRDAVMQAVSEKGVPCMQRICPEVYLEKAFEEKGERGKGRGQKSGGSR